MRRLEDAPVVVGGGKWATWRGPPDPAGLSKACGQVPQQLSTGWLVPAPSPARWRATIVSPSPVWSACTPSSSRCGDLRQEVSQSHRLVAVWTWSSGTYTPTKGSTIATALLSQEARLTFWTLVDDVGAWDTAREWRQGGRRVPLAPGCLTTRVVAKATPTARNKAVSTQLAHAGHRVAAIVTQRGARHSRSPCVGAAPACV